MIKPAQHIGKQVAVPGSYWEGKLDAHEKEMKYMCTIREYKAAYKWGSASNAPVTQAIELQEMGPEGRGSLELGDASGEIFHMTYPEPFLQYFYDTFPEQMPMPVGAKPLSPPGVTGAASEAVDEDVDETKPDVIPEFPHVRLGRAPIYQHWPGTYVIASPCTSSCSSRQRSTCPTRPTWSRSSRPPGCLLTRTLTRTILPPSLWSAAKSAAIRRHSSRAVMP